MTANDHVLARKDFPLMKALTSDPQVIPLIKATVHPWADGGAVFAASTAMPNPRAADLEMLLFAVLTVPSKA